MSQFNFRFQKLLDLKENEKDIAKIKMADAIKQEETAKSKNDEIYQKIADVERLKKEKQQEGVPISELRLLESYVYQLQQQLLLSNRELMYLQRNVSKSKSHLQQKAQEEKTWVNLKNEQKKLHEEKAKADEQNFFDELASVRFYRASIAERG